MHRLNLAAHLLAGEKIIRMALRHGAQFTHVHSLAQVHLHVPADLVGERNDVLSFARQIGINTPRFSCTGRTRLRGLNRMLTSVQYDFPTSGHASNLNFVRLFPQLGEIVRCL